MAFLPATFAINPEFDVKNLREDVTKITAQVSKIDINSLQSTDKVSVTEFQKNITALQAEIENPNLDKQNIRRTILKIQKNYKALSAKELSIVPSANAAGGTTKLDTISTNVSALSQATDYAPWWVILMISTSLGLGTMIGWKRIVVTIGEKIGSEKLNFAQATTGAIMTAITIRAASDFGLPVSTTHIMSSSIAGTSSYEHGRHGLQLSTVKNILMAWVLTLPITILGA
jgi:phosphate/sulfate permease